MKKEYDFSKAVRGRFYKPKAKFNLPVYLESEVQDFVQRVARNKRCDLSTVVNELLKSDMRLAEVLK
jgi:hypothetical protein